MGCHSLSQSIMHAFQGIQRSYAADCMVSHQASSLFRHEGRYNARLQHPSTPPPIRHPCNRQRNSAESFGKRNTRILPLPACANWGMIAFAFASRRACEAVCGCGGIGRRVRFRSVWASAHGGSSPLTRTRETKGRRRKPRPSCCRLQRCGNPYVQAVCTGSSRMATSRRRRAPSSSGSTTLMLSASRASGSASRAAAATVSGMAVQGMDSS